MFADTTCPTALEMHLKGRLVLFEAVLGGGEASKSKYPPSHRQRSMGWVREGITVPPW